MVVPVTAPQSIVPYTFNRIHGPPSRTASKSSRLDAPVRKGHSFPVSITLDIDDQVLASLPLHPGERERMMQIELACRFYANGWLTLAQGARMANLDRFAFGVELAERGIPRQYSADDLEVDLHYAGRQ